MENKILFNNICSIENAAEDGGVLRIEGYCAHYGKPNLNMEIVDEMIAPNVLKGSLCKFSTEGYIQNGIDGIEERGENYYVRDFLLTGVAVVRTPADPKAVFCVKNYMDAWKSEHAPKRKWYVMF